MFNVTNELENRERKKMLMMKVANERAISIPSYLS